MKQVHRIDSDAGRRGQVRLGPRLQIAPGLQQVTVGIHPLGERGRHRLTSGMRVPGAAGPGGAGGGRFAGQLVQLGVLGRLQPPDLLLERADAGDLADICRNAQKQKVAGDIERTRGDVALIGVRRHFRRPGQGFREMRGDGGVHLVVRGEEVVRGSPIPRGLGSLKLGRRDEAASGEVLIAGRFGLPVPKLLVLDFDGGHFGDPFEAQRQVTQVGDGRVPVLKVEVLEELRRIVRPDPIDGLSDGIGGPAVAGQRVGALLGRHRGECHHAARFFLGHETL